MKILHPSRYSAYWGIVAASMLIAGCSEEFSNDPISGTGGVVESPCSNCGESGGSSALTEADAPYLRAIKALGYGAENVAKKGEWYIIDGDIYYHREDLDTSAVLEKALQRRLGTLVAENLVGGIRVQVDPSIAAWNQFIVAAIENWNSVTGTRVFLQIVTANPQITIRSDDSEDNPFGLLTGSTCGAAWGPAGGNPGRAVAINMDNNILANSNERRVRTITHELGHAIGLAHTNDPNFSLIAGTPVTDVGSLMNGGECDVGALVLSANDILAIRILYPIHETGDIYIVDNAYNVHRAEFTKNSWENYTSTYTFRETYADGKAVSARDPVSAGAALVGFSAMGCDGRAINSGSLWKIERDPSVAPNPNTVLWGNFSLCLGLPGYQYSTSATDISIANTSDQSTVPIMYAVGATNNQGLGNVYRYQNGSWTEVNMWGSRIDMLRYYDGAVINEPWTVYGGNVYKRSGSTVYMMNSTAINAIDIACAQGDVYAATSEGYIKKYTGSKTWTNLALWNSLRGTSKAKSIDGQQANTLAVGTTDGKLFLLNMEFGTGRQITNSPYVYDVGFTSRMQ